MLQSIIGGVLVDTNKMFLIDRKPEYVRPNGLILYSSIIFYYKF